MLSVYFFSKFNCITKAICNLMFTQNECLCHHVISGTKKMAEAQLSFEEQKTILKWYLKFENVEFPRVLLT